MPFKWYPKEEILPHAAAWRLLDLSESNGRPIDLVIATKFPTYFVRHPQQGRVADPPVPRRLRAVRHAVQRFRSQRAGRRPARHADRASTPRCSASAGASSRTRRTPPTGSRSTTALAAEALYHPPRLAARLAPRPGLRRLRPVGRPDRVGQAGGPAGVARWLGSISRSGWLSPATAPSAPTWSAWRPRPGVARPGRVPRGGRRRAAARRSIASALAVALSARSTRTSATSRSRRSCRGSRSSPRTDSGGPNEFVVDGVNGFVCAPEPEAVRATAINALAARPAARRVARRRGYERARTITWDGVIEKLRARAVKLDR